MTPEQASKKYNVTRRTLDRWVKTGKITAKKENGRVQYEAIQDLQPIPTYDDSSQPNSFQEQLDAFSTLMQLPPGGSNFYTIPQALQYSGIFSGGKNFYINGDEALRASRQNATNMLRNLDILIPLQSRMLWSAELGYSIEPEDKKDPYQCFVAKEIQAICEDIPDFLKLRRQLLWAIWFGCSGVQLSYYWNVDKGYPRLCVRDWQSVEGDSIEFKYNSDAIAILVGNDQGWGFPFLPRFTTEPTQTNRAHVLDSGPKVETLPDGRQLQRITLNERERFVVMRHDLDGGDFFDPYTSGNARRGVGVRNYVYWTHYVVSEMRGWLSDVMERNAANGVWLYKFQRDNAQSLAQMTQLAQSQSQQLVMLMPVDIDQGGKPIEGIEHIPADSTGVDNLLKVIQDYYGRMIRHYIIGQSATSEPVHAGLGSEISNVQERTAWRLVKYDATNLGETLTRELVAVIKRWTFGQKADYFKVKYVPTIEKPDIKEYMEAVKMFVDIGGAVVESEVRSVLGLKTPDPDELTLRKAEPIHPMEANDEKEEHDAEETADDMDDDNKMKFDKDASNRESNKAFLARMAVQERLEFM